ncbi:hypothetical protein RhiirC2_701922 [Rhizophagus irregularis]|uniref:Uncharacterized protein n=1 Tax=Rhizophagus irregularis TaxID=588596 RepID=A0A2N1MNH9_9GLOM|nr:hypothetical protein RhiirC2_701922 [Rhizophagus irregularis]
MVDALRLLDLKRQHNFSDNAYNDILKIFGKKNATLFLAKKKLDKLVKIVPNLIDICINSCCAFTGKYEKDLNCQFCDEARYIIKNNKCIPRKTMAHIPLLDRLKIQYEDKDRALLLRYRNEYTNSTKFNDSNCVGDIFDGNYIKKLLKKDVL